MWRRKSTRIRFFCLQGTVAVPFDALDHSSHSRGTDLHSVHLQANCCTCRATGSNTRNRCVHVILDAMQYVVCTISFLFASRWHKHLIVLHTVAFYRSSGISHGPSARASTCRHPAPQPSVLMFLYGFRDKK